MLYNQSTKFVSILVAASLVAACGGRTAHPVMVTQYGDAQKSCDSLAFEINQIEGEMSKLVGKRDKTGKNVALGVTGFFLIVPLFFMDFKNAPKVEYEAYRQRYNHLAIIANDKKCGVEINQYPTVEEFEREQEAEKKKGETESDEPIEAKEEADLTEPGVFR